MSSKIIDLEEIVMKWVEGFPLDRKIKNEADDILPTDINWKYLRVQHGTTEYLDQVQSPSPKSHLIFSANFSNDTNAIQVYTLKTERRTTSTCTIHMEKTYTYGFNVDIKLTPPNPIVEANAGFKGELGLTKSSDETFEEEIVWGVDNQISVPPWHKTKADLVIKEETYTANFQTQSKFEGRVSVTLRSKKDNTPLTTLHSNVEDLFTSNKGFKVDKTGVYFVSKGSCKCRFGIEQDVKLSQEKLREPKDNQKTEEAVAED